MKDQNIDTKCLDELPTKIQNDKRTKKRCQTNEDEDEDRNELWIPIATLCKDELIELSQEIIDSHLNKSLDWRKMKSLSAEDHDAVMWIAKLELIELFGNYSKMAHSFKVDTSNGRRTTTIVPGTAADGAKISAGLGLTNRRKVRDIEKANKIADDIKAIEDDTILGEEEKKQALQKKRDQGLQVIDNSAALTGEEKERTKKILSEDLSETERQEARKTVNQELMTLKGKSKFKQITDTVFRGQTKTLAETPNGNIPSTASSITNAISATASSSNGRSASQQSLNSQQSSTSLSNQQSSTSLSSQQSSTSINSQQSQGTSNSQPASATPNGQRPPSTTATKSRGKRRRQVGKVSSGLGEAAAVGVGESRVAFYRSVKTFIFSFRCCSEVRSWRSSQCCQWLD